VDLSKHAFFEGKIVPLADAKLSIATHGFLYGTSVFGGMRSYWNEEQQRLFVFRPYDHFRRLLQSARMMAMQSSYDEESLIQLTLDLLRTDNCEYRDAWLFIRYVCVRRHALLLERREATSLRFSSL